MIRKGEVEPHRRMEAKRDRPGAAICRPQAGAICRPQAETKHAPWAEAICPLQVANPRSQPEDTHHLQVAATRLHHSQAGMAHRLQPPADTPRPLRVVAMPLHRSRVDTPRRPRAAMAHPLLHLQEAVMARRRVAMAHHHHRLHRVAQPSAASRLGAWAR